MKITPLKVLRIDADKTLLLFVAFPVYRMSRYGVQKSFRWGRKAGNCNSNQSVVAWMHLKNSSHWPCTRTLLFDKYDVIHLSSSLVVRPAISCEVNSQRFLWLEVEGSSSRTERRTSPVRKCEGVNVDMHSMSESLT
ncbi:hypothetical protein TNCV_5110901 [Trichonephila clavipes]|nr:hypothetical protein TNCV_5110901 [Trichonephila clavipes]